MKSNKKALVLIAINLVILIVVSILRMNTVARYNLINYIYIFLIVTTSLIMFAITYSLILKRFKRTENVIDQKEYAKLYDLENVKVNASEIQFYFTIERTSWIKFYLLDKKMETISVLKEATVNSGGHIVKFDTSSLENDSYFYCLETDNQKTMKKFWFEK